MEKIATAGNRGTEVRSDCHIEIKPGTGIHLKSKVQVLYGESIINLIQKGLDYFGLTGVEVNVEDSGALDYIIMARLEAAVKRYMDTDKNWLPEFIPQNNYSTEKDKLRRSRLYLPGNNPTFMVNAGIHHPDGVILDLEDSVSPTKKYEARFVVRNALIHNDFYGCERMARINQGVLGLDDLEFMVPYNVNLILLPKCESADQVLAVVNRIKDISARCGRTTPVWIMPIIESALGVLKAHEIASAHEWVSSLSIGLEDFTADLGTSRTPEGNESFTARSIIVLAAKSAGIQAIDSVYSDFANLDALAANVQRSKAMGYDGMGCIHPRQIRVLHDNYAPNQAELDKALKIVDAFEKAREQGLGVVALGSKMIDAPVVKRAQKTVDLAIRTGKLAKDWRTNYGV